MDKRRRAPGLRKQRQSRLAEEIIYEDEEETSFVRPPDEMIGNHQVFFPEEMQQDDQEMYEAIRKSREEFLQHQQRIAHEKAIREQRRSEFAMPISRLKTWLKFSDDPTEKELIGMTLSMIESQIIMDEEGFDMIMVTPIENDLRLFLQHLSKSKLFHDASKLCIDMLNQNLNQTT